MTSITCRSPAALEGLRGELGQDEAGGSDGARTRHNCNARLVEVEALSQGVSQESVPSDLKEVVKAWSALNADLRAAVPAVVRSAKKGSDGCDQGQDLVPHKSPFGAVPVGQLA